MTKAEIANVLYTRIGGFSKKEANDLVDLVFELIKETLAQGRPIKISGFGNFNLRDKGKRPGRNPKTGTPIQIGERRVLTFKASPLLRVAVNQKKAVPQSHPALARLRPISGQTVRTVQSGY